MRDYERAAGFRRLAAELGTSPAALAHRYALSLGVDTLVLGVKNRTELAECVAAAEAGPLSANLIARVDGRSPHSIRGVRSIEPAGNAGVTACHPDQARVPFYHWYRPSPV